MQTSLDLKVEEKVDMVCSFLKGKVKPLYFRYKDKTIRLHSINMVNKMFRGEEVVYFISASNQNACYYFRYESGHLSWVLERVWYSN